VSPWRELHQIPSYENLTFCAPWQFLQKFILIIHSKTEQLWSKPAIRLESMYQSLENLLLFLTGKRGPRYWIFFWSWRRILICLHAWKIWLPFFPISRNEFSAVCMWCSLLTCSALVTQRIEEGTNKDRVRSDVAPSGSMTSLIISKSKRSDSGDYTLTLTSDEGVESATFTVKIIG